MADQTLQEKFDATREADASPVPTCVKKESHADPDSMDTALAMIRQLQAQLAGPGSIVKKEPATETTAAPVVETCAAKVASPAAAETCAAKVAIPASGINAAGNTAVGPAVSPAPIAKSERRETLLAINPEKPATSPIELPPGISPAQFSSPEARARSWATYTRSLQVGATKKGVDPDGERSKRSDKCSQDILSQIAGKHEKMFYFQVWLSCGSAWGNVKGYEEHMKEYRKLSVEKECWLTDAQMFQIWRDQEVVDELKLWAEQQIGEPRVRLNPRIPHCLKAKQFHVSIEDAQIQEASEVLRQGMKMEFDVDGEMGQQFARQHMDRSVRAFGPTAGITENAQPHSTPTSLPSTGLKRSAAAAMEVSPKSKKKQELLDKFEQQEAAQQQRAADREAKKAAAALARKDKIQRDKETRQEYAKTPEGRAKSWLSGLHDLIAKAQAELDECQKKTCPLPGGLAKEYCAVWQGKILQFEKAKKVIDAVLKNNKACKNFEKTVQEAEASAKEFKGDLLRFKTLWRSYVRMRSTPEEDAEE